jgi:ABC-type dipeptide/oligopeptide/nickel transport system permease component
LAVPLLLGVATVIFLLIHCIPGDPVEVMLGPGAGPGDVADLRHRLGLDRPLALQYTQYLGGVVTGNLGTSLRYHDPVASLIVERCPATFLLAATTMLLALAISFPAGIAAALNPGGLVDRASALGAALALSIPSIWLGPLLILMFSIHLDWLPVSGFDTPLAVVLPAATLAVSIAALLTRMVRGCLNEEMTAAYLQAARSRGLSRPAATVRHALRNALAPVLAAAALQMGSLLTGAILTETIFAWPGLGRLLVQAIAHRDYPLVQGCVLVFAATYIVLNLAADLCIAVLDPRVAA